MSPSLTRTDVVDTFDMRLALHHAFSGAAAIRGAILSPVNLLNGWSGRRAGFAGYGADPCFDRGKLQPMIHITRPRVKRTIPKAPKRTIPADVRGAVKNLYKRCVYCGSRKDLTIDHIMPESRGGSDDISNLIIACRSCNGRKESYTPEEAGMEMKFR